MSNPTAQEQLNTEKESQRQKLEAEKKRLEEEEKRLEGEQTEAIVNIFKKSLEIEKKEKEKEQLETEKKALEEKLTKLNGIVDEIDTEIAEDNMVKILARLRKERTVPFTEKNKTDTVNKGLGTTASREGDNVADYTSRFDNKKDDDMDSTIDDLFK